MSADFPANDPNGRRTAAEPEIPPFPVPDLQTRPSPPPPPESLPEVLQTVEVVERVRRSPTATKLRLLLRCHEVAARARRMQALARFGKATAVVALGLVLGVLAGLGVFTAVYNNPETEAQSYTNDGWTYTYFVKGEKVTQQQYDYYIASHSNLSAALSASIAVGLMVLAVIVGTLWLRGRKPEPVTAGVDEQVAAIVRDHPEAVREWGGPAVLRQPELVAEILRIEAKSGR